MDFSERQRILRRILSSKLFGELEYKGNIYPVTFQDPSMDVLVEADWVYKKTLKELSTEKDALTEADAINVLIGRGVWTNEMDKELKEHQDKLKSMNLELHNAKFHKARQKMISHNIEKAKSRMSELIKIKNQLQSCTIEYLAEQKQNRFIIDKISRVFGADHVISSAHFKDYLYVYYYKESGISEKDIRKLARSDPWRLIWATSRDTGTPLFRHSVSEITDLQYLLMFWTRVYDFAFENPNRPPNDVIDDDFRFDAWYEAEQDRLDKEQKRNDSNFGPQGGAGNVEVFIPADKDGAKEVYDLNNDTARGTIRRRQEFIAKQKEVMECNLPDVKTGLLLAANANGKR